MNKKASALDLIFIGVSLLVFAVVVLIVFHLSDSINTEFQASSDITTKGKESFSKINSMYSGVLDKVFLFLAVGMALVAFALASLVRVSPIFFVFFLLVLFIIIIISGVFSNIYLEMANTPALATTANQLPFTNWIMYILPFFVGIMGFVLSIIMYSNWRSDAG